jgi:hypothetical protein
MLQTKFPGRKRSEFPRRKVTPIHTDQSPSPKGQGNRDTGMVFPEIPLSPFPCQPPPASSPGPLNNPSPSVNIRGQNQDSRRSNGSAHPPRRSTPFADIRRHSFPFALKKSRPRMAPIHTDQSPSPKGQGNRDTGMVFPRNSLVPIPLSAPPSVRPRSSQQSVSIREHPWSKPRFTKVEWLRPSSTALQSIRAHSPTFVSIRVKKVRTTDGTDSHGSIQPQVTGESGHGNGFSRRFPCPHSLVSPSRVQPRSSQQSVFIREHPWSKPRFAKVEWLRPSSTALHSIHGHSRTFVSIRVKKVRTTDGTDSHGSIQPQVTGESEHGNGFPRNSLVPIPLSAPPASGPGPLNNPCPSVNIRGQNQDSRRSNGSARPPSCSPPFAPIRRHSFPFALKKSGPRMARIHTDPSSRRR